MSKDYKYTLMNALVNYPNTNVKLIQNRPVVPSLLTLGVFQNYNSLLAKSAYLFLHQLSSSIVLVKKI